AAADGERHEHPLGRARHHVEDDRALLVRRGNVEEAELVGPVGVIAGGGLDRVAGVGEIDEADAPPDPAGLPAPGRAEAAVEARDDAASEHQPAPATASASASTIFPV